jgi:site-specific recombinase XerD
MTMNIDNTPTLAMLIQTFFTRRLLREKNASPHTVKSYRDCFRLLLRFAESELGRMPSELTVDDLDASRISKFLDHLEVNRGNIPRTRNARLAAVHSFYKFVALEDPAHAAFAQRVLAMPTKRSQKGIIEFLNEQELEALLAAPDLKTWSGRRDRALLLVAIQTGFRVSELTSLQVQDVELGPSAYIRCTGKRRKNRCTPLRRDVVRVLRSWLRDRGGEPTDFLFPNARGLRMSRDGVAYVLDKHVASASQSCPSLRQKRVTPHVLRHSLAMTLLHSGVDRSVIALWLGHETAETVDIYLHADLKLKERALSKTTPSRTRNKRYRPPDQLLDFLESL